MAQSNAPGVSRLAAVVVTTNVASLKGLNTYDGYTLKAEDIVLLTGQTTKSENGTYAASVSTWKRALDAPAETSIQARIVTITKGSHGGSQWLLNTNTSIKVGVEAQEWEQIGGPRKQIPAEHGRSAEMTAGKITIAAPSVTATGSILITTEGGTAIGASVVSREVGVGFTVEATAASTDIINWAVWAE